MTAVSAVIVLRSVICCDGWVNLGRSAIALVRRSTFTIVIAAKRRTIE
jgi:hypothetical protein